MSPVMKSVQLIGDSDPGPPANKASALPSKLTACTASNKNPFGTVTVSRVK
ncbi:hypothetical protein DPMN_074544 [Dreissena polymorpha]|uniref:Uncharacterized protein n=1 Tax=Dreissena polymorpha TaxID=45954 RepID=A0A9D4BLT3_DREPO|nr:hypothetical protein DPMN_074544 [Dreissena polymorpha]